MSNYCDQIYDTCRYKDRQCIIRDPTADPLEVTHIIYENGFSWNVEAYDVKIIEGLYFTQFQTEYGTECAPTPPEILLKGLFVQQNMIEHIWAFAFFCDKQARKNATTTAAADYAARAARTAAAAARAARAAYAARAAAAAAAYAAAAYADAYADADAYAARKEQWEFLVSLLKGGRKP